MEEGFAPAVNAPPCGPDVHDLLTPPTITTSAMANRRDPRCLVCWHEIADRPLCNRRSIACRPL
jgi:hypothetical protein